MLVEEQRKSPHQRDGGKLGERGDSREEALLSEVSKAARSAPGSVERDALD